MELNLSSRVLIVEPSGNLWGSERVLLDFLSVASKSSWEIAVCCPPGTQIIEPLSQLPVKIFPNFRANLHLQKRRQRLQAMLGLLRAAVSFRPSLIYVNQAGATRIALFVGRLLRIPVITHVRLAEDVQYVLSLHADRKALPKVLCISQYIRDLFPDEGIVSSTQLVMLYDLYSLQSDSANITFNSPIPDGEPIFSCVGRLAHIKGQDILLNAISVLNCAGVKAQAIFVGAAGPGDEFGCDLQRLSKDLAIEEQVIWAGFQSEASSHLSKCVAQVCPSRIEPLGRVVFEAWDAGTIPIAWAGSGGPAEVIRDSGGGLLYEQQTGECLAETLKVAISMKQMERGEMIKRGRAWLREYCDPHQYAQRMLSLWEEVAGAR